LSTTIHNGGKPQINGKDQWQPADHKIKPVYTFLPASHVEEQTRGEKLAALLFPWQPLVKVADHTALKSGVSIPETVE
jgi:hypothetical protein